MGKLSKQEFFDKNPDIAGTNIGDMMFEIYSAPSDSERIKIANRWNYEMMWPVAANYEQRKCLFMVATKLFKQDLDPQKI